MRDRPKGKDRRPWKTRGGDEVRQRGGEEEKPEKRGPPREPARAAAPGLPPRVSREGSRLFTLSRDPKPVYGEFTRPQGEATARQWDPRRSKLAAALLVGARVPLRESDRVLYLGAASGTTVSHVADIVDAGEVVAVESAPVEFSKLLSLAERRHNVFPVLANARKPGAYAPLAPSYDVVYQDIAQRDQVRILEANVKALAKPGTVIVLMVKTRSIDVAERPEKVARDATEQVQAFVEVKQVVGLHPMAKEHWCVIGAAR
jgi:fibrillarin-like pre-rRNA processing protein